MGPTKRDIEKIQPNQKVSMKALHLSKNIIVIRTILKFFINKPFTLKDIIDTGEVDRSAAHRGIVLLLSEKLIVPCPNIDNYHYIMTTQLIKDTFNEIILFIPEDKPQRKVLYKHIIATRNSYSKRCFRSFTFLLKQYRTSKWRRSRVQRSDNNATRRKA